MRFELAPGRKYIIKSRKYSFEGKDLTENVRMKLVSLHSHVARFERPAGYMESFDYWMLDRLIISEG